MEQTIKKLESMAPVERTRALRSLSHDDLKLLAKELRVSVSGNPYPDKPTLVSALSSWFNI